MDGKEVVLQQAGLKLATGKNLISEPIPETHFMSPMTLFFSRIWLPSELLLCNTSDSLSPLLPL